MKLHDIANELLVIEQDFERRGKNQDDYDMETFEQVWGSTALGFGGVGGSAMTTAMTYVFIPKDEVMATICANKTKDATLTDDYCLVYFGSQFAYTAPLTGEFWDDVCERNMASVAKSSKYRR